MRKHKKFIRELHSVANCVNISGQSGEFSPFCDLKSMYFDDSYYENEMHYKISKLLDEHPLGDEWEELRIICDNEKEYNDTLDALFRAADGKFKIYGVSNNPMEFRVDPDPREKYRKFDESMLMDSKEEIVN